MKFTLIVAVLFLLSFSASAGIFLETFDDKDLEGWQELVQLNNAPGAWEVIDDELHAVSQETFLRLLLTGDDTWKDYTVEFDVKPLKKHGIGAISIAARVRGTWAIACRIEDPVELVDGKPIQREWINCRYGNFHDVRFIQLHAEPHSLLRLNKWAHLKLSVDSNIVTFWINEKQMMTAKILNLKDVQAFDGWPDFLTGGVGFGLANYTARFDNIKITGDSIPNRGELAVVLVEKLATTWGSLKRF